MSRTVEQIAADALALPYEERARLAHRLLATLDAECEDAKDVEQAWEGEIRHRLDEYRAGRMKAVPASEMFAKARRLLR